VSVAADQASMREARHHRSEQSGNLDLIDLVASAHRARLDFTLIERPSEGLALAGIGTAFELLSTRSGAATRDSSGRWLDAETASSPVLAAGRLWRRLAERLRPDDAFGPVALGGFAFDTSRDPVGPWRGFPRLRFRVPRLALSRTRDGLVSWGDRSLLDLDPFETPPPTRSAAMRSVPGVADWVASVSESTKRLRAGEADKVVLAQQAVISPVSVWQATSVARALRDAFPTCLTYVVSGREGSVLVGASPELLIRLRGDLLTSQPLAGSVPRGRTALEDGELAARLLTDSKLRFEHLVTVNGIVAGVAPFVSTLSVAKAEVLALPNVQHLATTVTGRLLEPSAGLLTLAAALHPSPAVGGAPTASALRLISELEGLERGWYAGAVGWIDAHANGELAIALRCGLLGDDAAHLYAGAGITAESDPKEELAEVELKLQPLARTLAKHGRLKPSRDATNGLA
jgi:isochorismate synthase